MKIAKIVVAIVLWVAVSGLAYWLYTVVNDPVQFRAAEKVRSDATKNRLLDIKVAQEYYKDKNNTYAANFNDLINTIKNDELTKYRVNGDPDDTTQVVTIDTIMISILKEIQEGELFRGTKNIDDLKNIPFSDKNFSLAMDSIKLENVKMVVFEAIAIKDDYLQGLNERFIKNPEILDLSIGSLTSASGKGSWE